jgi:hypothetical protein
MIDHDDGDIFWLASMFTSGPVSLFCLLVFVVFAFFACQNDVECQKKSCPAGMSPKLADSACLCITEAK